MAQPSDFGSAIVIVTGGASGIGRALCEALATRGASVVVADMDGDGARKVSESIAVSGGSATAATVDVSQADAVNALVLNTVERYGRLDFMFNNAGIAVGGATDELEESHWQRVIDVNLWGVVNGVTAAYRVMREQRSGHIVNTASMAGVIPLPLIAPYAATKHAVVGLSLGLRPEAAEFGVRVSVVCPGIVQTNIYQAAEMVNADRSAVLNQIPVTPMSVHKAAEIILRGVARNRSVIIFPFMARLIWWAYRLHPNLITPLARAMIRRLQPARSVGKTSEDA